jgi:putative Mn2+ efflux pump MntP
MPVVGWYSGFQFVSYVEAFDHWIAFVLLALVGVHMILPDRGTRVMKSTDPSRGLTLIVLSIATSIDALAVGFSLAVLRINIWYPCIVIGVTAAVLSLIGIRLGTRLGTLFGRRMEIVGGIILVFIGLRILYSHILV